MVVRTLPQTRGVICDVCAIVGDKQRITRTRNEYDHFVTLLRMSGNALVDARHQALTMVNCYSDSWEHPQPAKYVLKIAHLSMGFVRTKPVHHLPGHTFIGIKAQLALLCDDFGQEPGDVSIGVHSSLLSSEEVL
jgi:hypothetical protein